MDDGGNVERVNKEKRRRSVSGRDEGVAESIEGGRTRRGAGAVNQCCWTEQKKKKKETKTKSVWC